MHARFSLVLFVFGAHAAAAGTSEPTLTETNAARVSTAMCAVGARMDALVLRDDAASRQALERTVAPTIAVLDDVARTGTPEQKIVAEHLRGDLYIAMAVRMRNSIGPITMACVGKPLDDTVRRHDELEPQLAGWLDRASTAYDEVRRTAAAHPEVLRDPVVAYAVRDSNATRVALTCPAPAQSAPVST